MAAIVTPRLILMPHSDDSVPLFTPPPPFSSPPRQITRCRFPSTNLARARGAREKLEEKNGGSGGARVCECMWGGGGESRHK